VIPKTQPKRILIVDDEPNVALMLVAGLEKLGDEYLFEIAYRGDEALSKLQQDPYDLLITDYSMPGMSGLDLAQTVRQISPKTQVVLMTAHGTENLRKTVRNLRLDGYIDKPFSIEQIRKIVKRAIERTRQAGIETKSHHTRLTLDSEIVQYLRSLRGHTGAQCVLLISSNGYLVGVDGQTAGLDVSSVGALVAGNFMAAAELANLLGSNRSVFKSSYHESDDYNIYAYDVNGEFLLAVIFDVACKPGVAWFYTKQTAAKLAPLVENQSSNFTFSEGDVAAALDIGFGELFDDADKGLDAAGDATKQNVAASLADDKTPAAQIREVRRSREDSKPMTFEQAVAAGLVPPQILDRERDR
jgi:CheY-like chemotaxis protein/predicted regulator of Ras-like GTPase activity (Roadblock/LC7/MglB family)